MPARVCQICSNTCSVFAKFAQILAQSLPKLHKYLCEFVKFAQILAQSLPDLLKVFAKFAQILALSLPKLYKYLCEFVKFAQILAQDCQGKCHFSILEALCELGKC
jgi:hypothetical protein